MRDYEKQLLNHLQSDEAVTNDIPLKNIKNALGSVAYVKGNPLTKTEIALQVQSFFWDAIAGVPLLPAALPPFLQTSLPVYLFSLTDFYGAFVKSSIICPLRPVWNQAAVFSGIVGRDLPAVPGTIGVNGDLQFNYVYVDALPTAITCTIVIHCNNVAYSTFLNSFVSDLITLNTIRCIVPIANINQFINPLIFGYQTLFGKTYSDSIDPRNYITATDFQQQIADIPINLPIDKAAMVCFQLDVFCQLFSFVLFVEKVEPLTHKN